MQNLRQMVEEPCVSDFDVEAWLWQDLSAQARDRLRTLLERSMQTELTIRLGYTPYRRDPQVHTNYRNGYYRRDLDTQFGPIRDLRVPRARQGQTDYRVLRRYRRHAPWVDRLVREMFVAGVSTRRVEAIMQSLLDASVSASTVSSISAQLNRQVRSWHHRPLEDVYLYLILDGVSLKIKTAHGVAKHLALCVFGITLDGRREVVDYRIARSESEAHWVALLEDLRRRGLSGQAVALAVTDGGQGLINALNFVYPRIPLQRCWAHKLRNVSNALKAAQREACMEEAKGIYQASSHREARQRFRRWRARWEGEAPKAVACLGKDLDSLLVFFRQPKAHWKKIRTTNAIERQFREVRRRTNPMTSFPHEESADRILWAIVQHANHRWAKSLLKEFTHNT